jgi:hypothetical protein
MREAPRSPEIKLMLGLLLTYPLCIVAVIVGKLIRYLWFRWTGY